MKTFRFSKLMWSMFIVLIFSSSGACGTSDKLSETGERVQKFSVGSSDDNIWMLLSKDGQKLIVVSWKYYSNDVIQIRETSSGRLIKQTTSDNLVDVVLSPDGNLVAIRDNCENIKVKDITDWEVIYEQSNDHCKNFVLSARTYLNRGGVAFLPDGNHIAYREYQDVVIADFLNSKEELHLTNYVKDIPADTGISLSNDGKWLVLIYESYYELRNLNDFSLVQTLPRVTGDFIVTDEGILIETDTEIVFSRGGKFFADLDGFCELDIYSSENEKIILTLEQPRLSLGDYLEILSNYFGETYCDSSPHVVFTADNKYVYYAYRNHILKWRLPNIP